MQQDHSNENDLKIDAYADALREQETLDCTGGSRVAVQAAFAAGQYWLTTKTGLYVIFTRLESAESYVHLVDAQVLNEPHWFAQAGFALDPAAGLDVRTSEISAFGRGRR